MTRDARARATDLLNRVDEHCRDAVVMYTEEEAELLALRHAVEAMTRGWLQRHPGDADIVLHFAEEMADAIGVVEP